MSKWKTVTKEEFRRLLLKYPSKILTTDIIRICTPEIRSYDDFSNGLVQPESMVGQEILHEWYKDLYPDAKNEYRIRTDHYERLTAL